MKYLKFPDILIFILFTFIAALPTVLSNLPFEGASAVVFYSITIFLTISLTFKKKSLIHAYLFKYLVIFTIWAVASSIFGQDFFKSMAGNYYRYDGISTLIFFVIFSYLVSKLFNIEILQFVKFGIIIGLVISNFQNENFLAGYLLVALPVLSMDLTRQAKLIFYCLIFLMFCSISSVAGALGLIIFIFIETAHKYFHKNAFKVISLSLISAIFLAGLFYVFKAQDLPVDARGRERIIRRAIIAVEKSPVIGWGWANVDYAINSTTWPIRLNADVYMDKAHSHLLEVLVSTGVIGLALYLLFLYKLLKEAYLKSYLSSAHKTVFLTITMFIIHSQTNVVSIAEEVLFWFFVGLVMGYKPIRRKN